MTHRPTVRATPRAVELHIEELVLHGFDARDQQQIANAAQGELHRLLQQRSLPASLHHAAEHERITGGTFQMHVGTAPETTGAQVARAIYGGLRQ